MWLLSYSAPAGAPVGRGLSPEQQSVHLTRNGGWQWSEDFRAINPSYAGSNYTVGGITIPYVQALAFALAHPMLSPTVAHSVGMQKGLYAVVNVFADKGMAGSNDVVTAHELLHTLGAIDQYNPSDSQPPLTRPPPRQVLPPPRRRPRRTGRRAGSRAANRAVDSSRALRPRPSRCRR